MQRKVDFLQVSGENFLSFKTFNHEFRRNKNLVVGYNLTDPTCISNGSGKSSFIEAIVWCIYKKFNHDEISFDGKGDTKVSLLFKISESLYRIDRYYKHKEHGSQVFLYKDDVAVMMRKNKSTDDQILDLIGMSYSVFIMTVTVLQGLPTNFGTMTPTIRKGTVEEMCGFGIWDTLRPDIQAYIKSQKFAVLTLQDELKTKVESMVSINGRLEGLKSAILNAEDTKKKEVDDISRQIRLTTKQLKLKNESLLERSTTELNKILTSLSNEKSQYDSRFKSLNSILLTKICCECGQNYPENKIKSAEDEACDIQQKIIPLSDKITSILQELPIVRELENSILTLKTDLKTFKDNLNKTSNRELVNSEDIQKLEIEVLELNNEVNKYRESISNETMELELAEYIDSLLLPSSRFRTYILERYVTMINHNLSFIAPRMINSVQMSFVVDKKGTGIDIQLTRSGILTTYKSLSGGQKRRLDLAIIFAFQRFLLELSGTVTNLLAFDEVFDSLDARGVQLAVDVIDSIFQDVECFYIITHNDSIKPLFSSVIEIEYNNYVSTIKGVA